MNFFKNVHGTKEKRVVEPIHGRPVTQTRMSRMRRASAWRPRWPNKGNNARNGLRRNARRAKGIRDPLPLSQDHSST